MKTILTLTLFFLFTLSAQSQSLKSGLTKTVDAINSMLQQDKNARFTNQDYALFYPIKINANLQGEVFCTESATRFGAESNGIMFHLSDVKSFVIKADEIVAVGHNQETIVAIFLSNLQESQALRKELEALRFICTTYSKLDPKFKCD